MVWSLPFPETLSDHWLGRVALIATYAVLSQDLFCRNLRTLCVEKNCTQHFVCGEKCQISHMQEGWWSDCCPFRKPWASTGWPEWHLLQLMQDLFCRDLRIFCVETNYTQHFEKMSNIIICRKADGLIVALSGNLERPLVGQSGTFVEPGSANLISFSVIGHL